MPSPMISCSRSSDAIRETVINSFAHARYEAKHLVIAQLVDRIEIRKTDGYDITIHWRMTAEQFLGRKTEASA